MSRRKRRISRLSAAVRGERTKNARTSLRARTTPGEPRSMRKLATASSAGGGALSESWSQGGGTKFLCHSAVRRSTQLDSKFRLLYVRRLWQTSPLFAEFSTTEKKSATSR